MADDVSAAPAAPATSEPSNSVAGDGTSPAPASPEGGGDTTDKPEAAEPQGEPPKAAEPPPIDKLTKWSQKLSRREVRLREREAAIAKREQDAAERVKLAEVLDSDDELVLLDTYGKRKGKTREAIYNRLTEKMLNPGAVPIEDQVQQAIRAAREQEQAEATKQQQARMAQNEQRFAQQASSYTAHPDTQAKYPYLAGYEPAEVGRIAAEQVIAHAKKTGIERPLDEVLTNWNNAEKKRIESLTSRLPSGDAQVQGNPERVGAGQPAKSETRKRTTISNSHAATRASPGTDDEDISDNALRRKAVDALRRTNTGWR